MAGKIFVEFMGVPGAGKTTIAGALYDNLAPAYPVSFPGREAYRRKKLKVYEKISLDMRHMGLLLPYRLRRMAQETNRFGFSVSSIRGGWRLSRYPAVLMDLAQKENGSLFILDEWLVHRTIDQSINLYPYNTGHRSRYVENFHAAPLLAGINMIYVLVEVAPDMAVERVMETHQPYRHFAVEKDREQVARTITLWGEQVVNVVELLKRRNVPLITINGGAPVSKSVQRLAESISRFIPAAAHDGEHR